MRKSNAVYRPRAVGIILKSVESGVICNLLAEGIKLELTGTSGLRTSETILEFRAVYDPRTVNHTGVEHRI